jgi:hypothetical protein
VSLVPSDRRRLAVLLVILVASGAAAVVVQANRDKRFLTGETGQGRELRLELDDSGRVVALSTSVESVCRGGRSWELDWTPTHGEAVFTQREGRLSVREVVDRPEEDGRISSIGAVMSGHVGDGRAGGELRLVARVHRGGREVQACDTGPLRWAAGAEARRRLAEALPPPRYTDWYYPKVPSLAGQVSAERSAFIEATDATCERTFRAMREAGEGIVAVLGDPARELAAYDRYVDAHEAQLRSLERLGEPPDGARLHSRWIENLRTRIRLERAQVRAGAAGEFDRARATFARIGRLMVRGNELGQRFGLRVCTSNGPDRTPVPH